MLVSAILLALAPTLAQAPETHAVDALGITLTFPKEFELTVDAHPGEHQVAAWRGKLHEKRLEVLVTDPPEPDFGEPTDVTERVLWNLRHAGRESDPKLEWDSHELVPGKFGYAPYASLCAHGIRVEGQTSVATQLYYLGGLLETKGYLITVAVSPGPNKDEAALVRTFLIKGVTYAGKVRDFKWSDDELHVRWKKDVPDSDKKSLALGDVIRTDHYVILTNSSGGKKFAEKMELCYATIKKVYPFEDAPGQRLMPVFLFRTSDEYFAFFAKQFDTSLEEARKSKGVASGDFYATWYEAPQDPVHIHEATHQIFGNRLMLHGGGSWFQEGVAEYICTAANERNDAARLVRDGKATPLREFMKIESLLFSPKADAGDKSGRNEAQDHYKQAALLIEFLRESKFGKDKFQAWLHQVGDVARNDLAAIEAATRSVYGVDLDGLEKEFVAYCKKR